MMLNQTPQLLFVNVELALRCNLCCLHCRSTAGKARSNDLEFDEWRPVMRQLAELGCRKVCILGGEPLLMPEWLDIAQVICDLGMNLVMITNGWLIEPKVVNKLKKTKKVGSYWCQPFFRTTDWLYGAAFLAGVWCWNCHIRHM